MISSPPISRMEVYKVFVSHSSGVSRMPILIEYCIQPQCRKSSGLKGDHAVIQVHMFFVSLGGGFKYFFIFTSIWGRFQF